MFWVYVLQNPSGKFYIGQTDNLPARLANHNRSDKICGKFTRKNGPWTLAWSELHPSRTSAMAREREIKRWKSAIPPQRPAGKHFPVRKPHLFRYDRPRFVFASPPALCRWNATGQGADCGSPLAQSTREDSCVGKPSPAIKRPPRISFPPH